MRNSLAMLEDEEEVSRIVIAMDGEKRRKFAPKKVINNEIWQKRKEHSRGRES